MTIFPNAKINIGLRIVSKREDGFHNIETIFYPLMIRDALEFINSANGDDSDSLTVTGKPTNCRMSDNLAVRAVNLLRKSHNIPSLQMHLHKAIPSGAGLGGGSSDASFMIKYLNRYFKLGLSDKKMKILSAELGSDCPFFIENRPAYAEGRGELLTPVKPLLEGFHIIIVNPGIHIDTGWAYAQTMPEKPSTNLRELYALPVEKWKGKITNDFEPALFDKYRELVVIRQNLDDAGAIYSSMSGSGSSIFGIFRSSPPELKFNDSYFTWRGIL